MNKHEERFWDRIEFVPFSGCWIWMGSATNGGRYGKLDVAGKPVLAHRYSYELLVGKIPPALEIDHKCRVRFCVNPHHLEAVTHHVNVLRGRAGEPYATRTECPHGHLYDEANTRIYDGRRHCRACARQVARERRAAARLILTLRPRLTEEETPP